MISGVHLECWRGLLGASACNGRGSSKLYAKMAVLIGAVSCLKIFLLLSLLDGLAASGVQVVTTENFTAVLEGEWMLEL